MTPGEAVQNYQCPGCLYGPFPDCFKSGSDKDKACVKHSAGTVMPTVGRLFNGMPMGFNRLGTSKRLYIYIFESYEDGFIYDKFNIPVWKYLDTYGNTLVRGFSPRTNFPWIHIFLGNKIEKFECVEITEKDIKEMN